MPDTYLNSFLKFLAEKKNKDDSRLPSLNELSKSTGTSIPTLREQLEVARAFGFVEVRPKTGIRKNKYRFTPAVTASLSYAIMEDQSRFDLFADLRKHLEDAYFVEAATLLTAEDIQSLRFLIEQARKKLNTSPIVIPFYEHRDFHLLMYSRLNNPFVIGLLEAYWQMYEEAGLNRYTDISYQQKVWQYHERIVDSIQQRDFSISRKALLEHMILIQQREEKSDVKNHFE
ncbi:MAG: FadR family transcriptional regulator [Chloroflexi bacterium]|nr:FadR family transcriptional regulator [Chloroflexota bacterium]